MMCLQVSVLSSNLRYVGVENPNPGGADGMKVPRRLSTFGQDLITLLRSSFRRPSVKWSYETGFIPDVIFQGSPKASRGFAGPAVGSRVRGDLGRRTGGDAVGGRGSPSGPPDTNHPARKEPDSDPADTDTISDSDTNRNSGAGTDSDADSHPDSPPDSTTSTGTGRTAALHCRSVGNNGKHTAPGAQFRRNRGDESL